MASKKLSKAKLSLYSRFSTWEDFFEAVRVYCDETFQPFVKRSSKKVDDKYVYQTYTCSHRGVFNPRGKGIRETKSIKWGCAAKIHACVCKEDQTSVVVKVLQDNHNHEIGPDLYQKYVKQRCLTKEERELAQHLIVQELPPKCVRNEIISMTGKEVTMQDIHNVKKMLRKAERKDATQAPLKNAAELAQDTDSSLPVEFGVNKQDERLHGSDQLADENDSESVTSVISNVEDNDTSRPHQDFTLSRRLALQNQSKKRKAPDPIPWSPESCSERIQWEEHLQKMRHLNEEHAMKMDILDLHRQILEQQVQHSLYDPSSAQNFLASSAQIYDSLSKLSGSSRNFTPLS